MSAAAAGSGAGVELSEAWTMEGGGSHHHTTSTIAAGVHTRGPRVPHRSDMQFSTTPSAAGECVVVLVTTVCAGILSPVAGGGAGAGAAELPAQVELRWGRPQS